MRDHRFEWDDRKAASNLRKHDVSFGLACAMFDDPDAIDQLDEGEHEEERFIRVGIAKGELLFVAYTIRGRRTRIISARKANRHEQQAYFREIH